jgi:hypothetical protein
MAGATLRVAVARLGKRFIAAGRQSLRLGSSPSRCCFAAVRSVPSNLPVTVVTVRRDKRQLFRDPARRLACLVQLRDLRLLRLAGGDRATHWVDDGDVAVEDADQLVVALDQLVVLAQSALCSLMNSPLLQRLSSVSTSPKVVMKVSRYWSRSR